MNTNAPNEISIFVHDLKEIDQLLRYLKRLDNRVQLKIEIADEDGVAHVCNKRKAMILRIIFSYDLGRPETDETAAMAWEIACDWGQPVG